MNLLFKKISLLSAPLALCGTLFGQAYTTPVGAVSFDAPAGVVALSNPFVSAIEFQGALTGSTATTLSVAGQDFASFSTGYYLEILSGGFEGNLTDIVSSAGGTLTVADDVSSLAGNEIIAIRKHTTLTDLLPAGSIAAFSDTVLLFDAAGAQLDLISDGTGGWYNTSFSPVSTPNVRPGQAVIVSSASGFSLTLLGNVKVGPTVIPVSAGVPNLLASLDPVDGMTLDESNIGSVMGPYSDTVNIFSTDGTASLTSALFTGTGFVATDFVTPVLSSIPAGGGLFIAPASSGNWVMPSVYNP